MKNAIDLYRELVNNGTDCELNEDIFVKWVAIKLESMLELLAVACEYSLEGELYYIKTGLFSSDEFQLNRDAFENYEELLQSALEKLAEAAKFSVALDAIEGYPEELCIADAFVFKQAPAAYGTMTQAESQQSHLIAYISEMTSNGSEIEAEYEDYLELLFELNDSSFEPEYEEDVQEAYVVIELSA